MRICNKCQKSVTPDTLGFQGKFPDYHFNSEIELCNDCTLGFKKIFDNFCELEIKNNEEIIDV
jgi:hypothetical protein